MAKKAPDRTKKTPKGDYPVGYAKAPDSGKIRPGEVRNPFGRTGKPSDAPDPLEYALSQTTSVTIGGETFEVTAEVAMHLRHAALALKGDGRAYKTILDEQRARRGRLSPDQTRSELEAEARELDRKKSLSARIAGFLDDYASSKKFDPETLLNPEEEPARHD